MNWIDWFSELPLVKALGWTLLHFVWQGFVIALGLRVALRLIARERADARYIAAMVALLLCAIVPAITFTMLSSGTSADSTWVAAEPLAFEPTGSPVADPPAGIASGSRDAAAAVAADAGWRERATASLTRLLPVFVLAWLVGVAVLSLRGLVGGYYVRFMKTTHVEPVERSLHERFDALKQRLGVDQGVTLLRSGLATVPCVVGYLKPVVLLPASAISGLSTEQLETILAHELAHVKRYDTLVNVVQIVIEALVFFHPAVWWISDHVRAEREHCCDDMAVATCGSLHDYVQALATLEEHRSTATPAFALAATDGSLLSRVRRLLETSKHTHDVQPASWAAGMLAVVVVAAVLLLGTPFAQSSTAGEASLATASGVATERFPSGPDASREAIAEAFPDRSESSRSAEYGSAAEAHDDEVVRALIAALPDADAEMRSQIAHTLGQREATEAVEALVELLSDENDSVRNRSAWALGMIQDPRAVEPLVVSLEGEADASVRNRIAWALGMIESSAAVPALVEALGDADEDVRNRSAWALGMIQSSVAVPGLSGVLTDDPSDSVRNRAAWALGMIEDARAVPALGAALGDADEEIRNRSAWALGAIGSPDATEALVARFGAEPSSEVKSRIAWALGMIGDERAAGVLTEAIRSDDVDVRRMAIYALGQIGT